MEKQTLFALTKENVEQFIGKRIQFESESYSANAPVRDEDTIIAVDYSKHNPLTTENGSDLQYAFVEDYGIEYIPEKDAFRYKEGLHSFCIGDSDREVIVRLV